MSDEAYKKYWDEWYEYEKNMRRPSVVKDHNFVDFKCTDCEVTSREVSSGMKSWVCFASNMSCCGNQGVSKWDTFTQQWKCSRCNAIVSNDPNYSGARDSLPYWQLPLTPSITPSIPKYEPYKIENKCTCGAFAINSNSHSPWCDWRLDK